MLGTLISIVLALVASQDVSAVASETMLSHVVPENISAFLELVEGDRALEELTEAELEAVTEPEANAAAYVAVLQPMSVRRATPPVVFFSPPEEYTTLLVAGPGVVLEGEVSLPLGTVLHGNDVIYEGWLLNAGYSVIQGVDGNGADLVLPPGGVLAITCSHSCSTKCDSETRYACCYYDPVTGCAHCVCILHGKKPPHLATCSSGGEGASECSMSAAMKPPSPRLETSDPLKR